MFAPTKTWRRWHRKINTTEKRHAVASAVAATGIPSLVFARGHRISTIAEIPLVVDNKAIDNVDKTSKAVALLKALGAYDDVEKAKASVHIRRGQGKMRNRRYVQRRGPLIIFNDKSTISRAFRNLPGVEITSVNRLNLLQLAPGGHLGRFCIWTKDAFEKLDTVFGTYKSGSTVKTDYILPRSLVANPDIGRIINSDEVQSQLRAKIIKRKAYTKHKNPFNNLGAMIKLNPYAKTLKRRELLAKEKRDKKKAELVEAKRKGTTTKAAPTKAKTHEKKINKIVNKTHAKFRSTLLSK
jgi:large subunit ribosomal protein L4e